MQQDLPRPDFVGKLTAPGQSLDEVGARDWHWAGAVRKSSAECFEGLFETDLPIVIGVGDLDSCPQSPGLGLRNIAILISV